MAYTIQKSNYVGIGNPDARRMWLDNDIRADYGRFASDRRQVLAASGTYNPWRSLTVAGVLSAITGAPINETVGTDVNGDQDNNVTPSGQNWSAGTMSVSATDSAGRRFTDRYSLDGAATAMDAATIGCARLR